MTANTMFTREISTVRARTRWSMAASVVLHALLLAWLILFPVHEHVSDPITEVTLLEPGDLSDPAPAAPAAPAPATVSSAGAVATNTRDEHFRRDAKSAETAPEPQFDASADDRLNARLAAIQTQASRPSAGTMPSAPASLWGSTPAVVSRIGGAGTSPVALTRGGREGGPALPLTRGGEGHGVAPALAPVAVDRPAEAAPAKGGEATARRTLAGATLIGPIADRTVLSHVSPVYPEWAKHEGVEGIVSLYFVVRPDGSVRENVLVQKTAGFEEFDENARTALRAWRFEPLRDGRVGDQWGTITFRFRLRDGG